MPDLTGYRCHVHKYVLERAGPARIKLIEESELP